MIATPIRRIFIVWWLILQTLLVKAKASPSKSEHTHLRSLPSDIETGGYEQTQQQTPPSCKTCQFPHHSWETFPVSFHCGRWDTYGPTGLEWLPEDLAALARYPLVTLEKWQGSHAFSTDICEQTGNCSKPSNVFYWELDAWISAAKQLKVVNPNISVAVWYVERFGRSCRVVFL